MINNDELVDIEWDKFKIAYHQKRKALYDLVGGPLNLTSVVHGDLAYCYSTAYLSRLQGSFFKITYARCFLFEIKA